MPRGQGALRLGLLLASYIPTGTPAKVSGPSFNQDLQQDCVWASGFGVGVLVNSGLEPGRHLED